MVLWSAIICYSEKFDKMIQGYLSLWGKKVVTVAKCAPICALGLGVNEVEKVQFTLLRPGQQLDLI